MAAPYAPAAPSIVSHHSHHDACAHGPAVTQDEAQAIADVLDMSRIQSIHVHWYALSMGVIAILHPIHRAIGDWIN